MPSLAMPPPAWVEDVLFVIEQLLIVTSPAFERPPPIKLGEILPVTVLLLRDKLPEDVTRMPAPPWFDFGVYQPIDAR